MDIERRFFNPFLDVARHANRLPHWQQPGATYFLTFRLADSIPQALMEGWLQDREIWLAAHPQPWTPGQAQEFERRFYDQIDAWLDEAHGACLLRRPELAGAVSDTLGCFDGDRFVLHAWVVMPNHVHALFTLRADQALPSVVKVWKGASARRINERRGSEGGVWQKDYFDRLVRDGEHFWRCARYIRRNPEKAGLRASAFLLHEHPSVREVLDQPESWR